MKAGPTRPVAPNWCSRLFFYPKLQVSAARPMPIREAHNRLVARCAILSSENRPRTSWYINCHSCYDTKHRKDSNA